MVRKFSYLEIVLLGAGLAADASCVCASNGLVYKPKLLNTFKMAIVYAVFQCVMPIIGFFMGSLLPKVIYDYNHIIAFVLLCYIGVKMIIDAYKDRKKKGEVCLEKQENVFTNKILILQGIATSIDALSVGFAFKGMNITQVINASIIIAGITFIMCFTFVQIGSYIGDKLNSKVELIGGVVLIALGIKMLIF